MFYLYLTGEGLWEGWNTDLTKRYLKAALSPQLAKQQPWGSIPVTK